MRKGQYLALESILSLSIGILIAVGSITMFTDYREEVLATGEPKQAHIVASELTSAFHTLHEAENGEIGLELPERIGGKSYTTSFNDDTLQVITSDETYTTNLQGLKDRYNFSGSANGGSVKVFKNGNEFDLRDD